MADLGGGGEETLAGIVVASFVGDEVFEFGVVVAGVVEDG